MRVAFIVAVLMTLAPQAGVAAACHCKPAPAGSRALQQPSTAREHAETERLNREYRAASQAPVAPPPRAAENVPPPARAAENAPQPTPRRSQFEEYRDLRAAYDRQLRAYYRAFPPPQAYARMQPPPAPAPPVSGDEVRWQGRSRLDPWHGYNPHDGLSNGY